MIDLARGQDLEGVAGGEDLLGRLELAVAKQVLETVAQGRCPRHTEAARRDRPVERGAQIVGRGAFEERGFLARPGEARGLAALLAQGQRIDGTRVGQVGIFTQPCRQLIRRRPVAGREIALGQHVADQQPVLDGAQRRVGLGIAAALLELEGRPIGADVGGRQRLGKFSRLVELDVEAGQGRGLDAVARLGQDDDSMRARLRRRRIGERQAQKACAEKICEPGNIDEWVLHAGRRDSRIVPTEASRNIKFSTYLVQRLEQSIYLGGYLYCSILFAIFCLIDNKSRHESLFWEGWRNK